jgi:hypothetical protein
MGGFILLGIFFVNWTFKPKDMPSSENGYQGT